ncbi:MAG: hypothetical protein ABIP39_02520, partial [Polyangiaceae bacterium]
MTPYRAWPLERTPAEILLCTLLWSRGGTRHQRGRWARRTEDGLWLIATARFAAAGRVFEELIDESRDEPEQHAGFVLQRAKTYLRQGSIDQALALFHAVNEWDGLPVGPARTELFASLAVAHTLRGDLDEARSWQRLAV